MTPGPWTADVTGGPMNYIYGPAHADGAKPIVAVIGRSNGNALADAAIIATAPKFLEVCLAVAAGETDMEQLVELAQSALDYSKAIMKGGK